MSGLAMVFVVLLVVGVIMLISHHFSAQSVLKRVAKSLPLLPVGEVTDSERARVVGTVELIERIRAPLSGRRCAYWHVVVTERVSDGDSSHSRTLVDEHGGTNFLLRDGDHKAIVETSVVKPILRSDARFKSGTFNDATPELEAFLKSRGLSSQGWLFNKDIRYKEAVVESDELVSVVGACAWERDPDERPKAGDGYRTAEAPQRLRITPAADQSGVIISDEPDLTRS